MKGNEDIINDAIASAITELRELNKRNIARPRMRWIIKTFPPDQLDWAIKYAVVTKN